MARRFSGKTSSGYGRGVLSEPMSADGRPTRPVWPSQPAEKGLVIRHRTTGVVGKIVRFNLQRVVVVDDRGREHAIPLADGAFSVGGRTVNLVRPKVTESAEPTLTASGSIRPPDHRARVAVPSRILVEGRHDAELVEKIWGDDLRAEGVVVEPLHGADDLAAIVKAFSPTPQRRLGILLDHLVENSKESRLAAAAVDRSHHDSVLITGHDFVDIWAAVRPEVLGLADGWPTVPMGQDWKEGVRDALGYPGTTGQLWTAILARVTSYQHLHHSLLGAVERLIDFVAPPPAD